MKRRCNSTPSESEHVQIRLLKLSEIYPSPENDKLYRPIRRDDPAVIALSQSIAERGLLDALIVTQDGYIVSGHRRHTAAIMAGLTEVPCRQLSIVRKDQEFLRLLREAECRKDINYRYPGARTARHIRVPNCSIHVSGRRGSPLAGC